jgi:uncharacterized membrane protein
VKRILAAVLVVAGLLVLDSAPAHAATVGGPRLLELLPGATGGYATAVNASGVVVGNEYTADRRVVPVRWINGHVTALEIPAGHQGYAVDINRAGLVVGNINPHGVPGAHPQAVTWAPDGRMTSLAPDRGDAKVTDVNDLGEIVGVAFPPDTGHQAAVRFADGAVIPLVSRADATVGPAFVANRAATDLLAGRIYTDPPHQATAGFVAGPNGAYATLPGQGFIRVMGISADGTTIAGMADGGYPATSHPVLWQYVVDVDSQRPVWHQWDLGTVLGNVIFLPNRISPDGTTVAGSVDASVPYASVWRDSSYYLLPTGWYANDVNDAGLVVGMDSKSRPVTWTLS